MFLGAPGLFVIDLNAHFALYIAFNVSRTIRRLIMEFGGDFRCHSGLSCLRMASSVNRNSTLMIINEAGDAYSGGIGYKGRMETPGTSVVFAFNRISLFI